MESVNFNQKTAEEIKDRMELNSFAETNFSNYKEGEINPDDLLTTEQIEIEKEKHSKRDVLYERFSVNTLLKFFLKDKNFELNKGIVEIESGIDLKLPEGYGFKGGAARTILRETLGLKTHEPRDRDLIRVTENEAYEGADNELASKYMGNDFEFGDGVEILDNTDGYFNSRDFTINEVYVVNNKIYATEDCIRDTIRGIVRVTDFELQNYQEGYFGLGPKMKAKALRFHVEQLYTVGISEIYDEDREEIESSFVSPFWLAVQLDRAFERSTLIANKFTELLVKLNIIPDDISNARELIDYLKNEVDGDFYFRSVPEEIYEIEEEYSELEEINEELYWEEYFDSLN